MLSKKITHCHFVLNKLPLKIHSIEGDYDSVAMPTVILPQANVSLT